MRTLNRTLTAMTGAIVLGGTALVVAPPASAATARNGKCEKGEFCYYFNSNHKGSVSDFKGSIPNYGTEQPSCYEFRGKGNGKGKCIKNDAASVWNRSKKSVRVHYNSNYTGSYQNFKPGAKHNLKSTLKNENASHKFVSKSPGKNMSRALYKSKGGHLTCGFDGYVKTNGRHEGIDFARGVGSDVRALVAGEVINIEPGHGHSGLSTIAIYNAELKKTVIYLHADPRSSLDRGQMIKRGHVIADESYHGAEHPHTHVEVRDGEKPRAAKSRNDRNLDNPDPTSFWHSQGYNIR